MTQEELIEMWEQDSSFTSDAGVDLRAIPNLHNKYYRMLVKARKSKAAKEEQLQAVYFKKHLYYSGKAPDEVYKNDPMNYTIMKSDLHMWIKADKAIVDVKRQIENLKQFEEILSEIVRQINDRKWLIRSMIDHQKLVMGDN